jgi:acyl-CoA thioesterase FadM
MVLPSDLDLNGHMNNGRYLSLMDIGRLDLTVRAGLAKEMIRRRWMPVLAGVTIRFRKSLQPWQRYELRTRIVSWDEEWFYMEQRFVRGETVHAIAHVKGIFLDRARKKVPVAEILASVGSDARPPLSPHDLALCFASPGGGS